MATEHFTMATERAEPTPPAESDPSSVVEMNSTPTETPQNRTERATKLVERFAIWAGTVGVIPVPVVDLVAVGALQLQMLRRLSQIYDVPLADNRGKALITSLAGAAIPTSSGLGAAEILKFIPIVGSVIGALVTPTLAAGLTYAIGKVFIQHFESGGTLLDFNPPSYREFLNGQREMWVNRKNTSDKTTRSDAPATKY
jgi:uncharacterized protein (DUF697 family)